MIYLIPIQSAEDVLQGKVFSVLFFLMAIATKCVQFSITERLFADDYNISIRSSSPLRVHWLSRETLNEINSLKGEDERRPGGR